MKNSEPAFSTSASGGPALIALVGNPNAGKTTLFNTLSGFRQKTANYPGATIALKKGRLRLGDTEVELLDLPGLYSLQAASVDEKIALDVILGGSNETKAKKPDLVLCIVDASNLKRNLLLYTQLADTGLPILLVLTMADLLKKHGFALDAERLSQALGTELILLSAKSETDAERLKAKLLACLKNPPLPQKRVAPPPGLLSLQAELQRRFPVEGITPLTLETMLLGDRPVNLSEALFQEATKRLETLKKEKRLHPASLSLRRYQWIDTALKEAKIPDLKQAHFRLSQKLDRIFTHRIFGLGIFVGLMFGMFQAIYSWTGPVMDGIEYMFSFLSTQAETLLAGSPVLQSLVSDGVLAGVGGVLVFLPQILLLFLFIAILEDSGYMARAAFLMDRLLGWAGLNGRAFIPMLSSFACAVPGVMAARVMPNPRARLTTILVSPLMSCSARLPVYVLLIGALIEPRYGSLAAALTLFFFHLLGLMIALPVAFVLNKGFLRTPSIPFLLEMPTYHLPSWKGVLLRSYDAGKRFVRQAGTIIFAMSILIWATSYFPRPESIAQEIRGAHAEELGFASLEPGRKALIEKKIEVETASAYLQQSYLGSLGRTLAPVFAPLGFDWKITVGILSAFPAREVIISTLGILYNVGDAHEESQSLRKSMLRDTYPDGRPVFTPLVAICLMIFFALSSQCMSTLATVYRELRSLKWTLFLFTYMTTLAYVLSLVVYQTGRWLGFA